MENLFQQVGLAKEGGHSACFWRKRFALGHDDMKDHLDLPWFVRL